MVYFLNTLHGQLQERQLGKALLISANKPLPHTSNFLLSFSKDTVLMWVILLLVLVILYK